MRADLQPTACLPFEPDDAKALNWLPLAVRYKLDLASLKLTLKLWQALPPQARQELLALPPGLLFELRARDGGAFESAPRELVPGSFREYIQRKLCGTNAV